jgi:GxxExxY protein
MPLLECGIIHITMSREPDSGHEIDTDFHRLDLDGDKRPRRLHAELTQAIIGAAFEVHKELGHGFLEKVYVSALREELTVRGIAVQAETPIEVFYKGSPVGLYYADLLIPGAVLCEVKAVRRLAPEHEAQLLNYLKATGIRVGLLLNFGGPSVQVKRFVF